MRSASTILCPALLVAAWVGACNDKDLIADPGIGGFSDQADSGTGGGGGSGGAGGAADDGPNPFLEAIVACQAEEPCPFTASVQLIENTTHNIESRTACVLSALAARRVGKYRFETNATFGNGSAGARHYLVVRRDGSVAYVREPYRDLPESATGVPQLPPIEPLRCVLKPAGYFDACVAAVQTPPTSGEPADDAEAWGCTFGDGDSLMPSSLAWFESCTREAPLRCQ
jgi:hypothetical protein